MKIKPFNDVFRAKSMTLNVSNGCNLNCSYCFENGKTQEFMDSEEAVLIFEKVYRNFKKNFPNWKDKFSVSFFGGEPFLNFKAMKAVMKYAWDKGYFDCYFGVTTNLTILNDEMIEDIKKYDLGLMISLDGTKEIQNAYRGNSYDIVVKNIKRLQENGLNNLLSVRMTILPETVSKMYSSVKHIVNDLNINIVHPYIAVDAKGWEDQEVKNQLLINWHNLFVFQLECATEIKYKDRNVAITPIFKSLLTYETFDEEHPTNTPCGFGGNACVCAGIGGEIQPCHQRFTKKDLKAELCCGNILEDKIDMDKMFGTVIPFTWTGEKRDCTKCECYKICLGACLSEGIDTRDSFLVVPEITCFQNEVMFKLLNNFGDLLINAPYINNSSAYAIKFNKEIISKFFKLTSLEVGSLEFNELLTEIQKDMTEKKEILFFKTMTFLSREFTNLKNILRGES